MINKYVVFFAFIVSNTLCEDESTIPSSAIQIDAIACRIISDDGIIPVYFSDIWLPSALGVQTTLEERIIRMIWIARGADRGVKMQNDGSFQEYAEEYLDMLQQNRGVTRDDLKKMCQSAGFTMNDIKKELNQQFLLQQSVETILMASGCLNISAEEIKHYYDENPKFIPAQYTYSQILVINDIVDNETKTTEVVNENEIADEMMFLKDMRIGDTATYCNSQTDKTYEIRLINKISEKLISLSERYESILRFLQQKKYKEAYLQYTLRFLADKENIFFNDQSSYEKCEEFIKKQVEAQEDKE